MIYLLCFIIWYQTGLLCCLFWPLYYTYYGSMDQDNWKHYLEDWRVVLIEAFFGPFMIIFGIPL